LLERDSFDLLLPEFDKPWVIHLREICCCSTNLCTWRPNTVYKNRRVRRHHALSPLLCRYEYNIASSSATKEPCTERTSTSGDSAILERLQKSLKPPYFTADLPVI
jgi:hypothetical protein